MANKIITSTIREPVLADIDAIHIARDPENGGGIIEIVTYTLHETDGDAFKTKQLQLPLSEAQKTAILGHVTGTVLPLIKEAEGPFED